MASAQGSRTGLVIGLVFTTLVSVVALIFAFVFSAQATKLTRENSNLTQKYAEVATSSDLNSPENASLKAAKSADPALSRASLFQVAIAQRGEMAALVGGTGSTPETAKSAAAAAISGAGARAKAAGIGEPPKDNLASVVTALGTGVESLAAQREQLKRDADAARKEAEAVVKRTTDQIAAKDKQIEEVRAQVAAALEEERKAREANAAAFSDTGKTMEGERKTYADSIQTLTTQNQDLNRQRQKAEKERDSARQRLADLRPNVQDPILRQVDGKIAQVTGTNVVYINRGQGDQITPGLTFEVYDPIDGIPAMKNSDDPNLPAGKGSIEVTRVGPNGSEARIVKVRPGKTISEGDLIANLVYDPKTKYAFVVYGKFDLTRVGVPSTADAEIMKRLVSQWGGAVQPEVGVNTDFLVIGAEPQLPFFSKEELEDPVNARKLAEAQADLDKFLAVQNKAKELFIPVLNQNRFLYYVGYFDQAHR